MTYDAKKVAEMTGESAYKKAPEYKLNELRINGKTGKFFIKDVLSGKNADGKYNKIEIGEQVSVVFLKHRRILSSYKKVNGIVETMNTNEHNSKYDTVMLFGPNERGVASDLREKYQQLRTHQIVYAYMSERKEIVKVVIKGASLGSGSKEKEVFDYYSYLGSFKGDEHCWQYLTVLKPEAETSDMGDYYCINFVKGQKLPDEHIEKIVEMIEKVNNHIIELDTYYASRNPEKIIEETKGAVETESGVEYPDEDINPDDIPF